MSWISCGILVWILSWDMVDDRTKKCSIPKNGFARVHEHFERSSKWSHFRDDSLVIPGFGDWVLDQNLLVDGQGLESSTRLVLALFHQFLSVISPSLGIGDVQVIGTR